ncbi:hypothetical protein [Nonomuraea basaltis]|nr:hypothetical protein [Nonomuraea basaltis]
MFEFSVAPVAATARSCREDGGLFAEMVTSAEVQGAPPCSAVRV